MSLYDTAFGALGGWPGLGALASKYDPLPTLDLVGTAERYTDVAATIPASTGQLVAAWRSVAGTPTIAVQSVESARPTAAVDGVSFGGLRGLRAIIARQRPETLYIVVTYTATSPNGFVTGDDLNASNIRNNGATQWAAGSGVTSVVAAANNTVLQKQVIAIVFNGALSLVAVNGIVSAADTGLAVGQNITVGARGNPLQESMTGVIHHQRLYRAAHTAARIAAETQQLAALHGITV